MVPVETLLLENAASGLWNSIRDCVSPYPAGVCDVPAPIPGTAFFPGGLGVWVEKGSKTPAPAFPRGGIMVVGQDFNSVEAYKKALEKETEVGVSPTWRELEKVLHQAQVPLDRCFFTNVYMGLRAGGKETGRFPGARDREFVGRCIAFFKKQLADAEPRLIPTLGTEPLRVLAGTVLPITAPRTVAGCVDIYPSVQLPHGEATVVALTHPSFYHVNVGRRRSRGETGKAAELAMIADGLNGAFP
jgi:hypothetical protein